MLNDFQITFHVSTMRRIFIIVLCAIGSGCIWIDFSGMACWILLLALWVSCIYAWYDDSFIHQLVVDSDYQAWILYQDECVLHQVQLLPSSLIHQWGCFLHWQYENDVKRWQVVLPDMLDEESFRYLRLWAMFGQKV